VDLLRCASASGFRNVYRAKQNANGVPVWRARVKVAGQLIELPRSRSTQPQVCAGHVVRWYAERFGARWPEVFFARKVNPFQVRKSKKYKGYVAAVWVEGRREEVLYLKPLKRNKWVPTEWLAVFATRREAVRGVWVYLARRYGLFGAVLLWREGVKSVSVKSFAGKGENRYTR
jgi:hypothetical protein